MDIFSYLKKFQFYENLKLKNKKSIILLTTEAEYVALIKCTKNMECN